MCAASIEILEPKARLTNNPLWDDEPLILTESPAIIKFASVVFMAPARNILEDCVAFPVFSAILKLYSASCPEVPT